MCRENFNGNAAIKPSVARSIHLAHATRANRRNDLMGTESGARGERHVCHIIAFPPGKSPANGRSRQAEAGEQPFGEKFRLCSKPVGERYPPAFDSQAFWRVE